MSGVQQKEAVHLMVPEKGDGEEEDEEWGREKKMGRRKKKRKKKPRL